MGMDITDGAVMVDGGKISRIHVSSTSILEMILKVSKALDEGTVYHQKRQIIDKIFIQANNLTKAKEKMECQRRLF
jgi:hypothetical protein